jgi:hypothetical protein
MLTKKHRFLCGVVATLGITLIALPLVLLFNILIAFRTARRPTIDLRGS